MNTTQTMHCRVLMGALVLGLVALTAGRPAQAGGNLEIFDFTNAPPSPIAGHVIATTRGRQFDERCIPIAYRLDTKVDPIPNGTAGAPLPLPLAQARQAIEQALATWNDIPTSFVEMRIVGPTAGGAPGAEFDFVNEVSFEISPTWGDGWIAASRSVRLIEDSQLLHGEDLDGDGDADISSAILECADVDGDGDIEFPAGFYGAGTILENDVVFDPRWGFTTDLSGLDDWLTQDLVGTAAHEFGHSLGLPHSAIAQRGPRDGRKTTMWYAPGDPVEKAVERKLHSDEIAWASFLYPEGSRAQGPGALQRGDVAFSHRYSVLRGEVREASGRPGTGSLVFAEDLHGNVITSAIAGRFRASFGDDRSFLNYLPSSLAFADGRFALPVPKGMVRVGVEPNDDWPDPTRGTTFSGIYPFFYDGSQEFRKEYYSGATEGNFELRLGHGQPIAAYSDRHGLDFHLDDNVALGDGEAWDNDYSAIGIGPQGNLLAVRITREEIAAIDRGRGLLVQGALFGTFPWNSSEVAMFDSAMITTGRVAANGTVTVEVAHPLARQAPFIGLDFDHTPLYVNNALALGEHVQRELPALRKDLFLVLALSNVIDPAYPGISRYGVLFDPLTPDSPRRGRSYYSIDGGQTWYAENPNVSYAFSLIVAPR
jgi:hypothetical protein